jgi:dihydrodipicolinate synthase/N-acetylneuraminate lyase
MPPEHIMRIIRTGTVIPAVPLALKSNREFDPRHQVALMRYYCEAGAGGVAVAVHTTQFAIRNPEVNLFEPVLKKCSEAIDEYVQQSNRPVVKIAGILGTTKQSVREAETAVKYGYHAGLLSLSAYRDSSITEMISHAETVAQIIPLFGFYLQPSVGGRILPFEFWKQFVRIHNIVAIKIAPFNRYQTLDVVRAVAEEGRENDITLYTGNDDNIIIDLITPYRITVSGKSNILRIKGGLLGQWAVGTKRAVELLHEIHAIIAEQKTVPLELLQRSIELTDTNAALFDAAHNFSGVIPGIHEILHRQGLIEGIWTLNPAEDLSEGQHDEITRVHRSYPHLFDDEFIHENIDRWLQV